MWSTTIDQFTLICRMEISLIHSWHRWNVYVIYDEGPIEQTTVLIYTPNIYIFHVDSRHSNEHSNNSNKNNDQMWILHGNDFILVTTKINQTAREREREKNTKWYGLGNEYNRAGASGRGWIHLVVPCVKHGSAFICHMIYVSAYFIMGWMAFSWNESIIVCVPGPHWMWFSNSSIWNFVKQ